MTSPTTSACLRSSSTRRERAVIAADARSVPGHALRLLSLALCAIVVLSFGLFAGDQAGIGSRDARAGEGDPTLVATTAPAQASSAGRARRRGRRSTTPPDPAVARSPGRSRRGSGAWATRIVPTVLALLVYGFGLGYLARYTKGRAS